MKHLGDITLIRGYESPVVDCIIGGSPCQDLSLAGKRAGLAGARSGLYMEQIRIIKEMRENDRACGRTGVDVRPRYMVWENVPGAFSSNKGKDFAAVLEEAIKVADPEAPDVPVPEKGWPTSGCIMGDSWSVAWRVLDAQFWGVPQRRRRIALVADFGGQSAPEILFVRKSVSRDLDESQQKRKATAGDVKSGIGADDRAGAIGCDVYNLAVSGDKAVSLTTAYNSTGTGPTVAVPKAVGFPLGFRPENVRCYEEVASTLCNGTRPGFTTGVIQPVSIENHPADSRVDIDNSGKVQTLTGRMGTGGGNVPMVMEPIVYDGSNITSPINAANPQPGDPCHTLSTDARNYVCEIVTLEPGTAARDGGHIVVRIRYIIRRLTPLECERLQGYPDGWTDIGEWVDTKGKKHKEADSPRYKALGNSIALPPWKWVLKRLCGCYERDVTMASLFDGIGGFPLIWEQLNGKGSCIWASEIEEFPMAVTKLRLGG